MNLEDNIVKILEDCKASNIVKINISKKSNFADTLIICTGRSSTHAKSTSYILLKRLKDEHSYKANGIEANSDWILIDLIDIVVNIMLEETRDFYAIERLWEIDSYNAEANMVNQ